MSEVDRVVLRLSDDLRATSVPYDLVASLLADGLAPDGIREFHPVTASQARGALVFAPRLGSSKQQTASPDVMSLEDEDVPVQVIPALRQMLNGYTMALVEDVKRKSKKDLTLLPDTAARDAAGAGLRAGGRASVALLVS